MRRRGGRERARPSRPARTARRRRGPLRGPQRRRGDGDQRRAQHVQRHQRLGHAQRVLHAAEHALRDDGHDEQAVPAQQRRRRGDGVQARSRARRAARGRGTAGPRAAGPTAGTPSAEPRGGGVARVRAGGGDERAGQRAAAASTTVDGADQPADGARHQRAHAARRPPRRLRRAARPATPAPSRPGSAPLTLHQASPGSTVNPPITACATTPSGCTQRQPDQPRAPRAGWRARRAGTARRRAPTAKVSSRLPNSTHWCSAATSGCGVGTRLPGEALRPGRAAQPGPGDPHDRPGDRDAGLRDTAATARRRSRAGRGRE